MSRLHKAEAVLVEATEAIVACEAAAAASTLVVVLVGWRGKVRFYEEIDIALHSFCSKIKDLLNNMSKPGDRSSI